jgi:hypothetical protein
VCTVRAGFYRDRVREHEIWRHVEYDVKEARNRAPAGYEAVVRVYLIGQEPVTLGWVRTREVGAEIWLRFEAEGPPPPDGDAADDTIPEQTYWVHAPASSVVGIEVSYRRAGATPLGFGIDTSSDG